MGERLRNNQGWVKGKKIFINKLRHIEAMGN